MSLVCLWNIPCTQGLNTPFLWEPSGWMPLAGMPRKTSTQLKPFPNSILIWTEQLGPLVPVEVQLAAPLSPGRQGEFSFATFLLGIRWQSPSRSLGTPSPHPGWARRLPWENGEAGAAERWRAVLSMLSPSLPLLSLCWRHSLRLNLT